MKAALLALVTSAAIGISAGSASALPPRYYFNPNSGIVYPAPVGVPGAYYYAPNSYPMFTSPRRSASFGNPNRGYPGVTNFGPSSGVGALHPTPMSWRYGSPYSRRWNW